MKPKELKDEDVILDASSRLGKHRADADREEMAVAAGRAKKAQSVNVPMPQEFSINSLLFFRFSYLRTHDPRLRQCHTPDHMPLSRPEIPRKLFL